MSYPIITRLGDKDAIHVCIIVAFCKTDILPGQRIKLNMYEATPTHTSDFDGVVNPFGDFIPAYQDFYVFMRPDVPRSLTHNWAEIPILPETPIEDDSDECRNCYN